MAPDSAAPPLTYDFPPLTRAGWEARLLRELPAGPLRETADHGLT